MDPITLLFLGGMLVVMYFFLIRPQAKQARLAKDFQTGIEKGSKVVTSAGIHGKVVKVEDNSVLIEVDNNVKMRVEKSHIHLEMTQAAYPPEKKPEPENK